MALGPGTVSVCIPVYNGAKYIGEALRSVLQQSYQDLDVVIVDNCSTDETLAVVEKVKDARVRVYRNDRNLGMLGNFNRSVGLCTGSMVKLLCADDVLYPRAIEMQARALRENAGVTMVCSPRDVVDAEGKVILRARGLKTAGKMSAGEAVRRIARTGTNPFGEPGCILFRAEAFAKTAGFSDRIPYLIDLLLYRELLRHGDLYVVPAAAAAFRVAKGSTSLAMVRKQAGEMRQFLGELRAEGAISQVDAWRGGILASANAWGRRLLYSLYVR